MLHRKASAGLRLGVIGLLCFVFPSTLFAQTPWIAVRSSGGSVQQFQAEFEHWDEGARWEGNYGLPAEVTSAKRYKVDSVRVINDSTAVVYSSSAIVLSSTVQAAVFPDTLRHVPLKRSSKKLPQLKSLIQENFPKRDIPDSLPVLDYPSSGKRRYAALIPLGITDKSKNDPPSSSTGIWLSWLVILGFGALAYRLLASRSSVPHSTAYVSQ